MYLSYPPLWNIVPDMDGFTTVRHWLDWASHGGPGYLNQDELPVEILECPLDVDLMIFRIKCFAASVVLHQAFVGATQIPSEDADRFRHVMDEMDQLCHRFHSKTWEALRTLRHDTDSARHHFFPHPPGLFLCMLADWFPPEHEYGEDMLGIRRGTIVEKLSHRQEDDDWIWVRIYTNHPHRRHRSLNSARPLPAAGWVPKGWVELVPCWHNTISGGGGLM